MAEEFHQRLTALCNRTWEALEEPLFCEPVLSAAYYKTAYKYVYRNPVAAGLCARAEDYEYSSLRGVLGRGDLAAPVIDNMGLIFNARKVLAWLNTPEEGEELGTMDRDINT